MYVSEIEWKKKKKITWGSRHRHVSSLVRVIPGIGTGGVWWWPRCFLFRTGTVVSLVVNKEER
jgi:hypothetical protein